MGPEAARLLRAALLLLAQLLVPDESKALVQPMNSRDAGPGSRLERDCLQRELLFMVGTEPQISKPGHWR